MIRLNRDHVRELARHRRHGSVSLFMPTHRAGPQVRQDPIRLKNLLDETKRGLRARGIESGEIEATLEPIRSLLEDREFWRNQGNGLAVLATPETRHILKLPMAVEELGIVSDRFQLKPLLPLLARGHRFYLLALSRQRVRLFEATRDDLREIDTSDAPSRLHDAVGYDWKQQSLQFYTATPGSGGRRVPEYHGQGAPDDDRTEELERFLRLVDDAVGDLVNDPAAPLVVAAVEEVFGAYRKVSRHPALAPDFVAGNPDHADERELLQRAWAVASEPLAKERRRALEDFRQRRGSELAVTDLEPAVLAAFDGRVDCLFLAEGSHRWGTFDPEQRTVKVHPRAEPLDEDLPNRAAVETLANDGDVYVVPPEAMPVRGAVTAASLRF